jgi:hypothetical protein
MSINKLKKIINFLVENELKNTIQSNDSKDDIFGKILFSPERKDNVDKTEPNTAEEKDLKTSLIKHYIEGNSSNLVEWVPEILNLINQGKYTQELRPPSGYVYRVLSELTPSQAASIVGVSVEEIKANATDRPWVIEKSIELKPTKNKIQSWTTSLIQLDFGNFDDDSVEIILEAKTDNNTFFLNPSLAKKIEFLSEFENENEVISLGTVACTRAMIYYTTAATATKSKIDINLVKKYVDFINKKGYEAELKINNYINKFYNEHDLSSPLDKLEARIEIDKKIKEFTSGFDMLLNKLEISLNKDFGENYKIVADKLMFGTQFFIVHKTNDDIQIVKFDELSLDEVKRSLPANDVGSTKNDISKILFRAFQRKQK